MVKKIFLVMTAGSFLHSAFAESAGRTVVTVTDKVLIRDCRKFGINIYNDPYYASNQGKKKAEVNFEGSLYRQCLNGPGYDASGFDSMIRVPKGSAWYNALKGADFTIISGPAKWRKGKIKDFEDIEIRQANRTVKGSRIIFAEELTLENGKPCPSYRLEKETERAGILVENLNRTGEGNLAGREQFSLKGACRILSNDVRPGGFGSSALLMGPSTNAAEKTSVTFNTCFQRIGNNNGIWHIRFWGKAPENKAVLSVSAGRFGDKKDTALTSEWKQYELTLKADKLPQDNADQSHLQFVMSPADQPLAIDDVEIWRDGDANPTIFNDDTIAAWREMNVGILRQPRMGGDTMENFIRPALQKYKYESSPLSQPGVNKPKAPDLWGLHDILTACEHLGAEPWWPVPGTLHLEEMDFLAEYLGGPETTAGGKLRHELGHPKPWMETIGRIHIEIGNEAWNTDSIYLAGGFNGADYWHDLFARLKQSPYYRTNMVCHAAGQNYQSDMADRILGYTKGTDGVQVADRYATALYQIHSMSKDEADFLNSDDRLMRWAFANGIDGYLGKRFQQQMAVSKKYGVEYSMYEINHHITGGNAPVEARDKITASIGGGLNILNTMLGCLKYGDMRDQCIFRWQMEFNTVPNLGKVRLWGINLTSDRDRIRYRPTGLAFLLCNQLIGGNLLETVHTGANPVFTADVPGKNGKPDEHFSFPVLHSYAFADGGRRGLIIFNFDLEQAQEVEVRGAGTVKGGAVLHRLIADRFTDTNELDAGAPKVKIMDENLDRIADGQRFTLPPCSMLTVQWNTQE